MHAKIITFAAGALFVLGNAVPLNNGKRDIVWVTEVETAITTVPVTTTVWVDPTGAAAPAAAPSSYDHDHGHRHAHSHSSQPAAPAQPTTSPEPAASSDEVPAAPASQEAPSSAQQPAPYVAPAPTTTAAVEPSTTAQAEQTTSSTPEFTPETTQAAVTTPESTWVAPTPTYEAPSSTSVAPAPASSTPASYDSGSSSSGSNPAAGKSFTGEVTYFTPGMGACGHTSDESEHMVAISQTLFDKYTPNGNPNKNPLCGATVSITGFDGTTYDATIWDRCTGCAEGDLDMPQSYFDKVTVKDGKAADGRAYGMSWSIM